MDTTIGGATRIFTLVAGTPQVIEFGAAAGLDTKYSFSYLLKSKCKAPVFSVSADATKTKNEASKTTDQVW